MDNISLILDIVKDIRNTIHDFQAQQNAMNSRVTQLESTLKDIMYWIITNNIGSIITRISKRVRITPVGFTLLTRIFL